MRTRTHAFVGAMELTSEIVLKCLDAANEAVGSGAVNRQSESLVECESLVDQMIVVSFDCSVSDDEWVATARVRKGGSASLPVMTLTGKLLNRRILTKSVECVGVTTDRDLRECADDGFAYLVKSARYLAPSVLIDTLSATKVKRLTGEKRKLALSASRPAWGALAGVVLAEAVDDYLDHLTKGEPFDIAALKDEMIVVPSMLSMTFDTFTALAFEPSEEGERGEVTALAFLCERVRGKTKTTLLGSLSFGHANDGFDGEQFHLSANVSDDLTEGQQEIFVTLANVTTNTLNDKANAERKVKLH